MVTGTTMTANESVLGFSKAVGSAPDASDDKVHYEPINTPIRQAN